MHKPFRFGVVTSSVQSHAEWVTISRRAEKPGSATLFLPDRPAVGFRQAMSLVGIGVLTLVQGMSTSSQRLKQ